MYTPLHASCATGQENVVKLLLELGVEVDAVNMYGNTPLHVACLNGQDLAVRELLLYNANINSVNHKGMVSIFLLSNYDHQKANTGHSYFSFFIVNFLH